MPGDAPTIELEELITTYLEMRVAPVAPPPPLPAIKHAVLRAQKPSCDFYRFLYDGVGKAWGWWELNEITDDALAATIGHERVEIYVLYVAGCPAGYAELDRRTGNDIKLAYFGIFSDYEGRGLGPYLLRFAVDQAWSYAPTRVWLHTCNADSPRALGVYQKAGFEVYRRKTEPLPAGLLAARSRLSTA